MISVLHFAFTTVFPEEVTITLYTINEKGRAVIIMSASCRRVRMLKQKGGPKEKAINDHT